MSEPETKSELTGLGELQAGELSIPGPAVRMPPRERQQRAHPHPQDRLCSTGRAGQRAGTAACWGRHYHSSRVFSPRYLFFCEEGMWGIYHRVLALLSAAASSMRGKQHRQMAGEVEAEEGPR